jgi:uncharacterized protein YuzE
VLVVKPNAAAGWATGLREYRIPQPRGVFTRSAYKAENGERAPLISVHYDDQADILTFTFTKLPQPAVAEEAADEVWVRYDSKTRRVLTVDVSNFSARVRAAFGPRLTYSERTDPQRLENLHGLPLPSGQEEA